MQRNRLHSSKKDTNDWLTAKSTELAKLRMMNFHFAYSVGIGILQNLLLYVCYSESERKEEAKKRLEKRLEKRENT